jgi:ribosome-associated protein
MNPEAVPWHLAEDSPAFRLAEKAGFCALTKQGSDVLLLDLRGKSDVCDFFLICTGTADVQVKAIAKTIQNDLTSQGQPLLHAEGLSEARWALLDFVDVVVHIFRPETRAYYQLERLWGDVPRVTLDEAYFRLPAVRQRHADLPLRSADMTATSDEAGSGP